ncbi:NADH-FMN oxidoreductase RutF, flavin reductase (DIM6/NTAB) family [Pseudomonas delhiensis]|uniref:NADH-FMN oxidoreductase RutF, flavin reductase (DIM6/NTAB) family n=1 Tax=Pseudomonas delhiensis TaxID=366289 RepID=A0A239NDA0_9PSED|nr:MULTISPECIES: flavin reductase family protein [Pseudomonas]MED5608814.1 flavin reductase family protein [Pseudomonas sp. JH-2]PWU26683.1 flavin reductase family protein [Pseudomonas sp. RW407]SDK63367.1 NADH-FMN oxidoreductase RutF, flavin reductase (DIM6/NTAB) family [Pseudomonas delhiensis]SNT52129.1 NADH-FMN oxidoreductase RutF, flavin reductase (DIM6/NTAB) family [Pseudomonas delhiensis]
MQLDFSTLAPADAYRWLASTVTPRPIAWVSTLSAEGHGNLAPFSFFQVISDEPPTLMVNTSIRDDGSVKDTLRNVRETGQLVIHLVSAAHAEAMNATAATLPHGVSEIEQAGIATLPSVRVAPPRVAGAVVAFECELAQIQPYPADKPSCYLIFARVLLAHIDDAVLRDERHVDPARLDLVGRLGGTQYAFTRDTFSMIRPK